MEDKGIGLRIRQLRERRGLTQRALAELAQRTERWLFNIECGKARLRVEDARRLADALRVDLLVVLDEAPMPPDLKAIGSADVPDFAGGAAAFSALELDPADLPSPSDIEAAVLRLRRSYSTVPPAELLKRVDVRLRQVRRLLKDRWPRGTHLSLLESGAWLSLLRATVLTDLEQVESAETAVRVAREIAREAGHREVEAWTWETQAWMAATDGRQRDAFDLATAGMEIAPAGTHGLVAVTMQRARVSGALGDEATALRDLLAGQRAYAKVPPTNWPDDHYQLDPAKLAFFASGAFAQLGQPAETIEHAAEVIRRNEDPATRDWWPTRVGSARIEWAMALVDQGQEDEAVAKARLALDPQWLRRNTELRTRKLLARMRDPQLRSQLSGELSEAVRSARPC